MARCGRGWMSRAGLGPALYVHARGSALRLQPSARFAAHPSNPLLRPMSATTSGPARGARLFRCALQVNPFAYLKRHAKQTTFADETSYNAALVAALLAEGIEVICVTDHYRVKDSLALSEAARAAGMHVLNGFEAVSKDGVHFLCIVDSSVTPDVLERMIGACGVHDDRSASPLGSLDALELLGKARDWNAVLVAAHASSKGGVLASLTGQARASVWKSEDLLACSLPGPRDSAPPEHRDILQNSDVAHRRSKQIAVINAQDVSDPADADDPAKSCLIKMTLPSVEALRQAFLDHDSRIRLLTETVPTVAYEIISLTWEGGFLDGVSLGLSPHLSCLIGGRGTGKSTAVESLRALFALPPLGTEARKRHEAVVKNVLRPGSKLTARVLVHKPIPTTYTVELVLPGNPVVRGADGALSQISAKDLIPGLEVYGQHEISELANDPRALTGVLARFLEAADGDESALRTLRRDLDVSRNLVGVLEKRSAELLERVAELPRLQEQLKRFEEAGFATHLKEQTAVINEAAELEEATSRLLPLVEARETLAEQLPLDHAALGFTALADSPLVNQIPVIQAALKELSTAATGSLASLDNALDTARQKLTTVRELHAERRAAVEKRTQQLLRSLGANSTDGQEYLRTKSRITELVPLKADLQKSQEQLLAVRAKRQEQLAALESVRAEHFRALERTAKRVTKKLDGAARVSVTYQGERAPLWELLRSVGGRMAEAIAALERHDSLTPLGLAAKIREGASALRASFQVPPAASDRLAQLDADRLMELEQLELEHTTSIELNVSAPGSDPLWKHLNDLSSGQKATAVLLLLLLESAAPLVIDQPEDDLDNRFIYDTVVPRMRSEKHRRQLIFATHNANIPVLGDAELIAGFQAADDHGSIAPEHVGALDSPTVKALVEQVLEGGREAFELRRRKYRY